MAQQRAYRSAARRATLAAVATFVTLGASLAHGAQLGLSNRPLYIGTTVSPNVFFQVDDSGSMDMEMLTRDHWEPCAYDPDFPGDEGSDECGDFIDTGIYVDYTGTSSKGKFQYYFDNSDNVYDRIKIYEGNGLDDDPNSNPLPQPAKDDWRVLSSDLNVLYYNPNVGYDTWPEFDEVDFSSARSHPDPDANGYNSTKDLDGFTYTVWEDDRGYTDDRPQRGGDVDESDASGAIQSDPTDFESDELIAKSGDYAFRLGGRPEDVNEIATSEINPDFGGALELEFWLGTFAESTSSGDLDAPESDDELVIEYEDSSGNWQEVRRIEGDESIARTETINLPGDANHDELRLRFRNVGNAFPDNFYLDNIRLSKQGGGDEVFFETIDGGSVDNTDIWGGSVTANTNPTDEGNGVIDLWDSHQLVTVYDNKVVVREISYSPIATGMNRTVESETTYYESDPNARPAALGGRTLAEVKENVATWYTYHRRRRHVATNAIGLAIQDSPDFRYGMSVINDDNRLFKEIPTDPDADLPANGSEVYQALSDFRWPSRGTPLIEGLDVAGRYYQDGALGGKNEPIISECQKNYTVLFTDGHYNNNSGAGNGDQDGDTASDTLADTAFKYYDTDLNTDLADDVPTTDSDPVSHQHMNTFTVAFGLKGELEDTDGDGWPNPELTKDDIWGFDPNTCSDKQCTAKIDDMWHAAYNSAGKFVSADTPKAVTQAIRDALAVVSERQSSASSLSVNTQSVSTDTGLFQATFRAADWAGQFKRVSVDEVAVDGGSRTRLEVGDVEWRAASDAENTGTLDDMDWDDEREILTYKPSTDTGIVFRWPTDDALADSDPKLDTKQQKQLADNPETEGVLDPPDGALKDETEPEFDPAGKNALNYIRGERDNEGTDPGDLRRRNTVLGDIVHSAPVFVAQPNFIIPETLSPTPYSEFRDAKKERDPMVYVGANDGMLHAFDAETGEERFAYVPSPVYENLAELTSQEYTHNYYVDGSPTYADAWFEDIPDGGGSGWRSVLVGTLRGGGQGVYALDITDPSDFGENNAEDLVLWEFTDDDAKAKGDSDLGYVFGQASVVRIEDDNEWVAAFGNGYNSTESDGNAGSGEAVLFAVDVETGNKIAEVNTKEGSSDDPKSGSSRPNGLSAPAVIDLDGDGVADYAYAGDLFGNLWRFDLSGKPNNWKVDKIFEARSDDGEPQPITIRPQVADHPDNEGGVMIYFGTGKYFETTDHTRTGEPTQTFYGIWDSEVGASSGGGGGGGGGGSGPSIARGDLQPQKITKEVSVTLSDPNNNDVNNEVRKTTDNSIDDWDDKKGWYMDLVNTGENPLNNKGERVINDALVRNDRVIFTTLVPGDSACGDTANTSWLMELNRRDGSRLDDPPFDLNDDARFDTSDEVGEEEEPPGGIRSKVGAVGTPTVLMHGQQQETKFTAGTTGEIEGKAENPGAEDRGRQSWFELR